jgi:hypothetical protein
MQRLDRATRRINGSPEAGHDRIVEIRLGQWLHLSRREVVLSHDRTMLPLVFLKSLSRSSRRTELKEQSSGSHNVEPDVCPNCGSDSTAPPGHESENDAEQQQRWELQRLKMCGCKESCCGEDCCPGAKTASEDALCHPSEIDLFGYRGSNPHNKKDKHDRQRITSAVGKFSGRSRHIVHA